MSKLLRIADSKHKKSNSVVVTGKSLDDWKAQLYGYKVDHIPWTKPPHMPQDIYDVLKKYRQT
jgi:hypothetical protein